MSAAISAADWYERRRLRALDSHLSYVEVGVGDPIVLLHGNPTSSYLWRNIIPRLDGAGRCLAPDLIGMGRSGKAPDGSYRLADHVRYLDAWFDALDLRGVTRPLTWAEWPEASRKLFQGLRSPAGEELILTKNVFVERILPGSVLRGLTAEEMDRYREPFRQPGESRRPTLTWPREIPLDGEPADVVALVDGYAGWLAESPLPKLFVNASPGAILVGAQREFCRAWPNQQEVTVKGNHFLQEDSPAEIAQAIARFLRYL